MKSKKAPLWLCFKTSTAAAAAGPPPRKTIANYSADGVDGSRSTRISEFSSELVHVIVKRGDDLRQDALTCQALSEMERMWRCNGLRDILLTPYRVVSTGYMTGMIEAVVGAETVASLTGSAAAALGLRGGDWAVSRVVRRVLRGDVRAWRGRPPRG
jgi:hypothetical protein